MDAIQLLRNKLARERQARKEAERILEAKALELYNANTELKALNDSLEALVEERTRQLIAKEQQYKILVENAKDIIYTVDENGYFQMVNPFAVEQFGYSKDEILGKHFFDFVEKSSADKIYNFYIDMRDQNLDTSYLEFKIVKKDGAIRWIGQNVMRMFNEGGERVYSAVARDITERKMLEEELIKARKKAEESEEAEKAYLANMSHEIRTPLNAILGMTHLLGDTSLNVEQKEYVNILSSSSELLLSLISDVLDFSKINAGKMIPVNRVFDLETLFGNMLNIFESKTLDKNIRFKKEIDTRLKLKLLGDDKLLSQVIVNLLSNAEKFTQKGYIELAATLVNEDTDKLIIRFQVSDTGIGIKAEEIDVIFKSFRQANKEIRVKYGGTGLGLNIANKIVNLLGGQIKVDSKLGEGSVFSFDLTILKAPVVNEAGSIGLSEKSISLKGHRVLVAEDNIVNQKYISKLLQNWQVDYDIAHNGLEALKYLKHNEYDLIFMDLQMPEFDGFETTRTIRKMKGELSKIKIIALSASTMPQEKQKAFDSGVDDFIIKPFIPDMLKDKLISYRVKDVETPDVLGVTPSVYSEHLDTKHLMELYSEDYQYALEMFEIFLESYSSKLEELDSIIVQQDLDSLKKLAHSQKSNYALVGLTDIVTIWEALERCDSIELAISISKNLFANIADKRVALEHTFRNLKKTL